MWMPGAASASRPSNTPRRRRPGAPEERAAPEPRADSPDGRWRVVMRAHNLLLRDRKSSEEFPLTHDGTADDGYENPIHWSPDSRKLAAMRTKAGGDRKVY